MRISDWSSDVCSSDLSAEPFRYADIAFNDRRERRFSIFFRADPPSRAASHDRGRSRLPEIGRASCRERVCQYVEISVVAGSLKPTQTKNKNAHLTCINAHPC